MTHSASFYYRYPRYSGATMSAKQVPLIVVLCLSALTSQAMAEEVVRVAGGVKLQTGTLTAESPDQTTSVRGVGRGLAMGAKLQRNAAYGAVQVLVGRYRFEDELPPHPLRGEINDPSAKNLDRGEVDLVAGYFFWPRLSLFMTLKSITNRWQNVSGEIRSSGLGMGASTFGHISANWYWHGALGVSALATREKDKRIGNARHGMLELAGGYVLNPRTHIHLFLKSTAQRYVYDDGGKSVHRVGALGLSLQREF